MTSAHAFRIVGRLRPELGRPVLGRAPRAGGLARGGARVTDPGALGWLLSIKCKLGYNFLIWDDGQIFEIIPRTMRAPHAGTTRTSDPARLPYPPGLANSAFYGVAFAAGGKKGDRVTPAAIASFGDLARELYGGERWPISEAWRITSHHLEACYPVLDDKGRPHPRAGQRGRKADIVGYDFLANPGHAQPVATLEELRQALGTIPDRSAA